MEHSVTWQELASQPERWDALARRAPPSALLAQAALPSAEVVLFGSGSSYYLASLIGDSIERVSGRRPRAVPACEVMFDPGRLLPLSRGAGLVIAVSRSGESSEAVAAARIARSGGLRVLGLTCTAGSTLAREASECLLITEGDEAGVVMLRSFTCMLLACRMALGPAALGLGVGGGELAAAMPRLVAEGRAMLGAPAEQVRALAAARPFNRFVLLGSGADFPLAQEAGLKLQEMASVTTEAYHTLEYRHGPRSTGGANTLAVLLAPQVPELGVSLVRDLAGQGLATLVIGADPEPYRGVATLALACGAGLPAPLRQLPSLLLMQVLAYETARRTGQDPDAPANLTKVVML